MSLIVCKKKEGVLLNLAMQASITIPTNEGQICKLINPFADENGEDVYIVAEDPSVYDEDDTIYIVSLNELQRNINNPAFADQIPVAKNELNVIAENLEEYIKNWNNKS